MTRMQRQIETRLGVDAAFAFIADFANAALWDPGTVTSDAIDAGAAGIGSRYRLGVRIGRRIAPMEYRITVFEPSRRVQLTGSGSQVEAVDDIRFSASAGGTHIDYVAEIRLGGVMRLAQPFLARAFATLADDSVEGMRRALDGRAEAPSETGTRA